MPSVSVEGAPIYFDEYGSGTDVLFWLHCFGGSARTWKDVITRFPDYRSIAIDLRGHGRSADSVREGGERGVGLSRLASDVRSVARSLDIERCVLIGHSIGGGTAVRLAVEPHDLLRGVISVSGQPASGSPRVEGSEEGLRRYLNGFRDPAMQRIAVEAGMLQERLNADHVQQLVEDGMSVNEKFYMSWLRDGLAYDGFADLLKGITVPITFIVGSCDVNIPPEAQLSSAALVRDARIVILNGESHWMPIESPERLAAEIRLAIGLFPSA
jgi:pimeloyl-ACP methyl ester carboxylesterase